MQNTLEKEIVKILPKVRQYSPDVQSQIIQYYVLYLLRSENQSDVVNICRALQKKFTGEQHVQDADKNIENLQSEIAQESTEDLFNIILALTGHQAESDSTTQDKLGLVSDSLLSMSESFQSLSLSSKANELNLMEFIELAVQNIKDNQTASNYAAENGFNRLFDAFNPKKAERYLDQSIERKGIEKKAAMFDAMQEKFEQLYEYHQQGRMLKDFHRDFKTKLRKQRSD